MAGNSLESLLAWMKDTSRMLGWDLIVALDGRKINLGLQQDHIIRLSKGSDLGIISGSIDVPETNLSHYLAGFRLASPLLSFEHATFQSARTALSLAVVGGTQMLVESAQGQKTIRSLTALDPLDGSHLTLDVPLGANEGEVSLDLADSENLLLTLFRTPNEQREAGKLFKAWFDGLEEERRAFALGKVPDDGGPLMLTRHIDVRTQKRELLASTQADNQNGAVLLFASMVDGGSGAFPGDDSGFRYLIPDDEAQRSFSATGLFSRAMLHRAAFGHAVLTLMDDAEFDRTSDADGALAKLVAKRGSLRATAGQYQSLEFEFESDPFSLPAAQGALPLTVEFAQNQAIQRWQTTFSMPFSYRPLGGTTWNRHTAICNINLQHEFRLWADESGVSAMEGELFSPYTDSPELSIESGLPTINPNELEQIREFIATTVKRALLERFSNTLSTNASQTFLEGVDVVGKNSLRTSHVAMPFDLVAFGQINASGAPFSIVQQQPLLAAGKQLQLTTEPAREGLRWTLEGIPGGDGDPGRINEETGLYRAPPAHAMTGSFSRVLAVATDPDTGEQGVTLITVQANPITINPQIQLCYHGQQVELSAGQLDGTALSWSIKNPVPGESGKLVASTEPGGDHTYIAGPQVAKKTYVLDEIEVKGSQGDETASAYVLVLQTEPGITVKPVENPNPPEGQVQMQAFVNGNAMDAIWSLPLGGPGSIDESGLYSDDMGARERFVLIHALIDGGGIGTFEGHLILPLPLVDFPAVISALAK